jgi:Fe-S-cluster containining protein
MGETLHFACTECGKCCGEAPEMSLLEAFGLGDVFIPSIAYKLTRIPKDDNEAGFASIKVHADFEGMSPREFVKDIRESVAVRAGAMLTGEPGWDAYIFVTARPWHYKRAGCPALDGKRCTIHDRRPMTCRTVPVRYDVPESLLVRAFHGTVTKGKAASDPYECDTSDKAPVFIENGELKDQAYVRDRKVAIDAAMDEKQLGERLLVSPYLPPLQEVVDRLRRSGPFSVSFHAAVVHASDMGKIDKAAALAFCGGQIGMLEREIAGALARKRPDEREWTTRFRSLLGAYRDVQKALSSQPAAGA